LWGSPRFGLSEQRLYSASVGPGEHGTLRDLEDEGDVQVIAAESDRPLRKTKALPGETIFVTCASPQALSEHDELRLWQDVAGKAPQPGRTWLALGILVAVILAATLSLVAVELAAFTGAVLMVVTGVLTPRAAVRALDWNVLFILAGSVGLGAIVVESGIADLIAQAIGYLSANSLPLLVVVFAVTTAILTNLVTNAAAASILTPVAITLAASMELNPVMLLALIGTCISFTFINPFSHQSNIMVLRPGGYSMMSFVRFGIPLIAVSLVSVCVVTYALLR